MGEKLLVDGPGIWAYQIPLERETPLRIGRAPENDIVLPQGQVSSNHASLNWESEVWILRDLKSSNGTLVNGKRVTEARLRHGDVIRIGKIELVYQTSEGHDAKRSWDLTQALVSQQEHVLRDLIEQATPGCHVRLPEFHLPSAPSIAEPASGEPRAAAEEYSFDPERFQPAAPVTTESLPWEDSLWVAEQVAEILALIATRRNPSVDAVFGDVLRRLRDAIGAENGFLMLPDHESRRWVIRAWAGEASEWTTYEKERPVPLTIANQAYKKDQIVSNAYTAGTVQGNPSESLLMLQVYCYIAVPLHRNGEKAGVLYFDTRRTTKQFAPREVRFLERVATYLLEIDRAC